MEEKTFWEAIQARDISKDGQFYYAVTSTGVFCRPSCPSRRPRRDRVRFFITSDDAQAAGFRPCRRCRPLETPLAEVVAYLDGHVDERVTLEDLAGVARLSPTHLQRRFKALYGLSPSAYLRARRAERLKSGLRESASVTNAMLDAGYGSSSRLYEQGAAALGMTPREYRARGRGVTVRYAVFKTALGWTAAAATDRGLCRVAFGDDPAALEQSLHGEFENALLVRNPLRDYAAAIRSLASGHPPALPVPLDVQGTAFQQRVWRELQRIPAGETRSYGQVAAAIGDPKASRAVARACATNHVAVVIPCHRVIRNDGETGGYRWGEKRKRELLQSEKRQRA